MTSTPVSTTTTHSPSKSTIPSAEMAPLPSSPLLPPPSLRRPSTEMAPPPLFNKVKPDMRIPILIPFHPHATEQQPIASYSSSSLTSTSTSSSSWPFSATQTPLTSGQNTPLSPSFPLSPHSHPKPTTHHCQLPQKDKKGNPLDVLERTYLKPEHEIDIEEALQAPPLPGTFRYVVERVVRGKCKIVVRKELSSEAKRAEFERVKCDLRCG